MRVKTIGVLGAGIMGRGIAQVAAQSGFRTLLYDVEAAPLDVARGQIRSSLATRVEQQKLAQAEMDSALALLTTTTDLAAAARDADLVIEAAPERIDLKLALFAELDRTAPAHAILASNTSSLSITEMAGATRRPAQVLGMHFFNPVP